MHKFFAPTAMALVIACPASAGKIDSKADIHPTAVLMGDVTVGAYTRIGPKAVIQGDIVIGHHVNILGSAVISAAKLTIGNYVRIDYGARVVDGRPAVPGITANQVPDQLYIKENCWVGMNATVRGAQMEEGSAVGNDSVADFNTHLEKGAILAHGAISTYNMRIPANALAEGNPARITKQAATDADRTQHDIREIDVRHQHEVFVPQDAGRTHRDQLVRGIDPIWLFGRPLALEPIDAGLRHHLP